VQDPIHKITKAKKGSSGRIPAWQTEALSSNPQSKENIIKNFKRVTAGD
jgi:hypothetical protein